MAGKAKFSPEQIDEFKELFKAIDRDDNGRISVEELHRVMTQLGQSPTDREVRAMIKAADTDGSGFVEFEEFVKMMAKPLDTSDMSEDELRDAFAVFDADNSGTISADELRKTVDGLGVNLSAQEIDEMIAAADVNADGRVNYSEFAAMMRRSD